MMTRCRRWPVLMLVVGSLSCTGCDLATMLYFMMPESKHPPLCGQVADPDKKKEVKALVWVLAEGAETRPELLMADRELAELLVKQLREKYEANGEKVKLISPKQVEDYKSAHPDCKQIHPREVGKIFKVDYVIVLEITSFSLLGHGGQVYQGRVDISLSLVNVNEEDEPPAKREFSRKYPSVPNEDIGDIQPVQFREKFLRALAKELALYFVAHAPRETHGLDED